MVNAAVGYVPGVLRRFAVREFWRNPALISPVAFYTDGKGYLPVEQYATADDYVIYFVTNNSGKTWAYDPSLDTTANQV